MNILSIDWDYFFPDMDSFDWQMNERKFFFYEEIWTFRWSNKNLKGELAKDYYKINESLYNGFWNKVLINSPMPSQLIIVDSHSDIEAIFNSFRIPMKIWNFDQHHDSGYDKLDNERNCGNWVTRNKNQIKQYNLIYPPWRKNHPENKPKSNTINITYSIPNPLPEFDFIFICRSSPWTPSWEDHKWIEFIEYFKINFPKLWKSKLSLDYAIKPREFNIANAKKIMKEMQKHMELLKKGKLNE